MTLRAAVRAVLAGDATYAALLPGGIYPTPEDGDTPANDATEISRDQTPAAFDAWGILEPVALVAEDSTVPTGPHRDTAWTFLRIWKWQAGGRDAIEAANSRELALLNRQRVALTAGGFVYQLRWAGFGGSGVKDQALGDASLGWSRWQVVRTVA